MNYSKLKNNRKLDGVNVDNHRHTIPTGNPQQFDPFKEKAEITLDITKPEGERTQHRDINTLQNMFNDMGTEKINQPYRNYSCFLISSLNSMMRQNPEELKSKIKINDDGTVTVRCNMVPDMNDGYPVPRSIDIKMDTDIPNQSFFIKDNPLWVNLYVKAYTAAIFASTRTHFRPNNIDIKNDMLGFNGEHKDEPEALKTAMRDVLDGELKFDDADLKQNDLSKNKAREYNEFLTKMQNAKRDKFSNSAVLEDGLINQLFFQYGGVARIPNTVFGNGKSGFNSSSTLGDASSSYRDGVISDEMLHALGSSNMPVRQSRGGKNSYEIVKNIAIENSLRKEYNDYEKFSTRVSELERVSDNLNALKGEELDNYIKEAVALYQKENPNVVGKESLLEHINNSLAENRAKADDAQKKYQEKQRQLGVEGIDFKDIQRQNEIARNESSLISGTMANSIVTPDLKNKINEILTSPGSAKEFNNENEAVEAVRQVIKESIQSAKLKYYERELSDDDRDYCNEYFEEAEKVLTQDEALAKSFGELYNRYKESPEFKKYLSEKEKIEKEVQGKYDELLAKKNIELAKEKEQLLIKEQAGALTEIDQNRLAELNAKDRLTVDDLTKEERIKGYNEVANRYTQEEREKSERIEKYSQLKRAMEVGGSATVSYVKPAHEISVIDVNERRVNGEIVHEVLTYDQHTSAGNGAYKWVNIDTLFGKKSNYSTMDINLPPVGHENPHKIITDVDMEEKYLSNDDIINMARARRGENGELSEETKAKILETREKLVKLAGDGQQVKDKTYLALSNNADYLYNVAKNMEKNAEFDKFHKECKEYRDKVANELKSIRPNKTNNEAKEADFNTIYRNMKSKDVFYKRSSPEWKNILDSVKKLSKNPNMNKVDRENEIQKVIAGCNDYLNKKETQEGISEYAKQRIATIKDIRRNYLAQYEHENEAYERISGSLSKMDEALGKVENAFIDPDVKPDDLKRGYQTLYNSMKEIQRTRQSDHSQNLGEKISENTTFEENFRSMESKKLNLDLGQSNAIFNESRQEVQSGNIHIEAKKFTSAQKEEKGEEVKVNEDVRKNIGDRVKKDIAPQNVHNKTQDIANDKVMNIGDMTV